jgi:hypothetical protein
MSIWRRSHAADNNLQPPNAGAFQPGAGEFKVDLG